MEALEQDPNRRFIWNEISFFKIWYDGLRQEEKESLKRIVERGQLEFVGGGWVQVTTTTILFIS